MRLEIHREQRYAAGQTRSICAATRSRNSGGAGTFGRRPGDRFGRKTSTILIALASDKTTGPVDIM